MDYHTLLKARRILVIHLRVSFLILNSHSYKFIVDGKWVCSEDEPKNNDTFGNINNYLII